MPAEAPRGGDGSIPDERGSADEAIELVAAEYLDDHFLPGEGHEVDELDHDEQRRNYWALVLAQASSVGYGVLRGTFVAVIVARYTASAVAISFALTAHRWIQPFVSLYIGRRSDRTQSRHGRRKPFMVFGLAVMGAAMLAVPLAKSYWPLLAILLAGSIGAMSYRVTRFSATPDLFGQRRWATMLVSIGAAGLLPGFVINVSINRTWEQDENFSFVLAGVFCLAGAVLMALRLSEPKESQAATAAASAEKRLGDRLREIRGHKNLMVLLIAGAVSSIGGAAIPQLYAVYVGEVLKVGPKTIAAAAIIQGAVSLPLAPLAIWAGLKLDRRNVSVFCSGAGALLTVGAYFAGDIVVLSVLGVLGGLLSLAVAVSLGPVLFLLFPRETIGEVAAAWATVVGTVSLASVYGTSYLVDRFQNYRLIWLPAVVGLVAAAVVLTRLDLPPKHRKPDIETLRRDLKKAFAQARKKRPGRGLSEDDGNGAANQAIL